MLTRRFADLLSNEDTIRRMSRVLRSLPLARLHSADARNVRYSAGGIAASDRLAFDADALRVEMKRREAFGLLALQVEAA